MNKFLPTFVCAILLDTSIHSQSLSQVLAAAEKSMASKNYYDALHKYEEALNFKENNIEFLFKAAEAARQLGAYNKAVQYYSAVEAHPEHANYPLSSYWLGITKQTQGDYAGAKQAFLAYKSEHQGEDEFYTAAADKEIKACEWAMEIIKNPIRGTEVTRLGDHINSEFSEMAPVPFGGKLYYSSLRFPNTFDKSLPKKYLANLLQSDQTEPGMPLEFLEKSFPGKSISYSTFYNKGTKVIFAVCNDLNYYDKECTLYQASIKGKNQWSDIVPLPSHVNVQGYTTTQPSVSYNEQLNKEVLYFVSNRHGGKGNLDIWYSVLDANGNFSEPINAVGVNTIQDDISPFFHSPTKTLYYSSKGHLGLGGFDVYSSIYKADEWSTPKNMAAPINSPLDDVFFIRSNEDLSQAYLASNRVGSLLLDAATEACCLDIYSVKLKPCDIKLKTYVYDAETLEDLNGATLKLYDLTHRDREPLILTSETTNLFEFPIDCDKEYRIDASRPGYLPESISFTTGKPGEITEITKKIYLKPERVSLDVLTFLRPDSTELPGCKVVIWNLTDPANYPPDSITNLNSNLSSFKLVRCHNYKITAFKAGLEPSTTYLTVDCKQTGKIVQKLYLAGPLYSLLPVELYFDNDRPDPRSNHSKTSLSYSQTYKSYYNKKNEFKLKYAKISNNPDKEQSMQEMDLFFEKNLKSGYDTLYIFLAQLLKELQSGKSIQIFIKGYASPRANNAYNKILSQRRISSVENEFARYKDGILRKYLKNGKLIIKQVPYGEEVAPSGIVDDINDPKSIYSIEASKERRVEIVDVKG